MQVEIVRGNNAGTVLSLGDGHRFIIGSESACEVCLKNTFVSGRHAKVFIEAENTILEDLDSDSGTAVTGKMLARTILSEGDVRPPARPTR